MNSNPILRAMVNGKKLRLYFGGPKLGTIPITRQALDELVQAGHVAPASDSGDRGQPSVYELTEEGRRLGVAQ